MTFNNIYFRNNQEGLLELCFLNTKTNDYLEFNGGGFSLRNRVINEKLYDQYKQRDSMNEVLLVKENDDMDFILKLNDCALMKIAFFPNDSYPNGVIQTFRVYYPEDHFYSELQKDLESSEDIILT